MPEAHFQVAVRRRLQVPIFEVGTTCGNVGLSGHRCRAPLAADAATAEIFATAAMMGSATAAVALVESVGLAGVFIRDNGDVVVTSTLKDFEP